MDNNLHDDKLDDYVRKSFEDYEEEPSSEMWSRVEEDLLPVAEVPTLQVGFRRFGWQAMAAAVILLLLSTLVCEHLYYEEKLRVMSDYPANTLKPNAEVPGRDQPSNPGKAAPKSSGSLATPTQSSAMQSTGYSGERPLGNATEEVKPTPPGRSVPMDGKNAATPAKKQLTKELSAPEKKVESTPVALQNGSDADFGPSLANEAQELIQGMPDIQDLANLPVHTSTLTFSKVRSAPVQISMPIKPLRETSGWYVGVQMTALNTIEKSHSPRPRPGRPAFDSQQEGSDFSSLWWFRTGKKLNAHFSLETGIGYQQTTRTATHTPRFRFGDGMQQGPPFGSPRTFSYDLSTYGGTAEVSLRMEETTPGTPPTDDEPVSLNIKTSEHAAIVRIPVLMGYQFGHGRWHGQIKAGLIGNFLVKHELDLAARVSQHARLQPVSGKDGYTVRLEPGRFHLGYWLSAGAEFKVNSQLGLVAEPSLASDFPRNDQYSRRLPDRFSLGLNVGANYYF